MIETTSTLNELEGLVLQRLLDGDDPVLQVLRQQLGSCSGFERELTGAGFFLRFKFGDDVQRVTPGSFHFGEVSADIEGLQYGAGFVLFVKRGLLESLEGYSYEEPWPERIVNPRVRYTVDGRRDLDAVRQAWSSSDRE
jgi:hypothetical protein